MKVVDILNYNRAIKMIIDNADNVNSLVKFKLLGMLKQFEPVVQNFEIIREEKIKEYGTVDDQGRTGIFEPKEEDFETVTDFEEAHKKFEEVLTNFNKDLDSVLNSESEIEITKFKYTDIMDAGLSSDYLMVIYDLIEE